MPTGRPPKPLSLVQGHRTKAEKEARAEGEKRLSSSAPIRKWKKTRENKVASAHFNRMLKAFEEASLNDVMYEAVLNRYCIILGECDEVEEQRVRLLDKREELDEKDDELDYEVYLDRCIQLEKLIFGCDATLQKKRTMLLQIEKENVMTVLGKLRAVPKKPEEPGEAVDPMDELLQRRMMRAGSDDIRQGRMKHVQQ